MIYDLVVSVLGNIPIEYHFIYVILSAIGTFALISILFIPFILVFKSVFKNNRGRW